MDEKYYEVGSRTPIEGGAVFSAGSTNNGYCYKSEKAIKERKGICYITESAFGNNFLLGEDKTLIKDKEGNLIITIDTISKMIDWGYVETWDSARSCVKGHIENYEFGCFGTKVILNSQAMLDLYYEFIDHITDAALEIVDWQGVDSYLNEMDIEEELDYFLAKKFVEAAKFRIEQDGDDTDIDDAVFEKNLFGFLGNTCYRDDEFNLTDWDSLIDKWENEPNH